MNAPAIKTITCREAYASHLRQPIELIDVRTPEEFQDVHATMARNIPLDKLDPKQIVESRSGNADEPLYFICKMGGRSAYACALLMEAGYPNVVNVAEGTDGWLEIGLPTECQF
jgi:rhodanese-related sulfurtransferase